MSSDARKEARNFLNECEFLCNYICRIQEIHFLFLFNFGLILILALILEEFFAFFFIRNLLIDLDSAFKNLICLILHKKYFFI